MQHPFSWLLRSFRFSLRKLLLLVTVASLALGVWAVYVQPYRSQANAMQKVAQCHGVLEIEPDDGPNWHKWLVVNLLGKDRFVRVTAVDLAGTAPSKEVYGSLRKLRFLRSLNLDRVKLDDFSLVNLSSLRELRTLSLRYTRFLGKDINELVDLTNLEQLVLTGTELSDADCAELAKLSDLKELFIRWTKVSEAGIDSLQAAMPNCLIHHHILLKGQRK